MIYETEEFNKSIITLGFKNIKVGNIDNLLNVIRAKMGEIEIQVFDADRIAGPDHLLFASLKALKAFKQKRNISDSVPVEVILYASGQRQIRKAIQMLGVRPETSSLAVVAITSKSEEMGQIVETVERLIGGTQDNAVLEISDSKARTLMKLFGLTDMAVEERVGAGTSLAKAVSEMIIEVGALLATKI